MFLCMLLCATLAYAQNRTIRGKVTDESNAPLANASVQVKSSGKGTTADDQGNFTITVAAGDVLVINVVGYEKKEVPVGTEDQLNISLKRQDESMQEVIVTAMGIRRSKNTLPYAAQQVAGTEISQSRSNNFAQSLSGPRIRPRDPPGQCHGSQYQRVWCAAPNPCSTITRHCS